MNRTCSIAYLACPVLPHESYAMIPHSARLVPDPCPASSNARVASADLGSAWPAWPNLNCPLPACSRLHPLAKAVPCIDGMLLSTAALRPCMARRSRLCAWILLLTALRSAQGLLDVFGRRAGRVSWVSSENVLEELKGNNASDDLHAIFRFDSSEGDWSELQALSLASQEAKSVVLMTDSRKLPRGGFSATSRGSLPYWVSSVYINLLYALRHHYDFLRVELPDRVRQAFEKL